MNHKALPLLQEMLAEAKLWQHPKMPFKAAVSPGRENVLVVAGDNCSGKSFLVETLRGWSSQYKLDSMVVSIRERSGGGLHEMAAMRRSMMFGDEHDRSTGAVSAGVVERAFTNLQSRAESKTSSFLVLDEPELGMSESMAGALGELLGLRALEMPELAVGLAVVTHSRALVQRMSETMGRSPTFVHMRENSSNVPELDEAGWLQHVPHYGVAELHALRETNLANWRLVNSIFEEMNLPKRKR